MIRYESPNIDFVSKKNYLFIENTLDPVIIKKDSIGIPALIKKTTKETEEININNDSDTKLKLYSLILL